MLLSLKAVPESGAAPVAAAAATSPPTLFLGFARWVDTVFEPPQCFSESKETAPLGTVRTTSHAGTMWFSFSLELRLLFWSFIFYSPSLGLNKRSRQGRPQLFKGRSLFLVKASVFDTVPALW